MSAAAFIGRPVQCEWLDGGEGERRMRLLAPFGFRRPNGDVILVPVGFVTDGASIPQACWSLVGGPFEGAYREPAIVHDWLCQVRTLTSATTHTVFYEGMRTAGVNIVKARLMWAAVRFFGPKW